MKYFDFDMSRIGRKISELRKERDMTQMELADRLGISYQAVSNWERGNSMPDIAKLPELAGIFEVTVDHLLGETNGLLDSVVKDKVEEYMEENEVGMEELAEVAPLLKPSQADDVFEGLTQKKQDFNLREIHEILPFISREVVEKLARKCADASEWNQLRGIAPFVSRQVMDELAWKCADSPEWRQLDKIVPFVSRQAIDEIAAKLSGEGKRIGYILPFLSKSRTDELAECVYKVKGLKGIDEFLPFLSKEKLMEIGEREYEMNGLGDFGRIAPFLNRQYLAELAKDVIEKKGVREIAPIAPFLDRKMLSGLVSEKYL